MMNDFDQTDQLKMRILFLEKELEKWRSDYLSLEEKLRRNPPTRDTFAIRTQSQLDRTYQDYRPIKDGKYS